MLRALIIKNNTFTATCSDGDVRLVVSNDVDSYYRRDTMYDVSYYDKGGLRAGRVEVCIGEIYGTVCDDGWDNQDASVVCRQLHLSPYGTKPHLNRMRFYCVALITPGATGVNADPFGEGDATRLLTNVNCSGSESTLLDCGRNEFIGVTCPTAGVVCQGSQCYFGKYIQ